MLNPSFSISMTNYNNGQYIRQAIDSILNQTYQDFELIIVDDCSTDNSIAVINNYLIHKKDSKIRLIALPNNVGVAGSHKEAFERSRGQYIAIIDSDDVVVPTALEEMKKFIDQNQDCGFWYSNYSHCDQNLNRIRSGPNHQHIKTIIEDKDAVSHLKILRRSDYLRSARIDSYYIKAFDRDLVLKMEEVCKFAYYPKELYKWRGNKQGISRGKNGKIAYKYYLRACKEAIRRRGL